MARNLILSVFVAAVALGCASNTQKPPAEASAANATSSARSARLATPCNLEAASRIKRPGDKCSAAPGTTYSQQDIEDTGQFNLADALKQLDPRIQ